MGLVMFGIGLVMFGMGLVMFGMGLAMFWMGLVRFTELCKALLRRGQLWIGVAWRLYHGCMEVIPRLHGGYTTVAWRLYHGCVIHLSE